MLRQIFNACLGKPMKFYTREWEGYPVRLFHDREDIRSNPIMSLIPYFWDSDITFELGVSIPKNLKKVDYKWHYDWELRDLDGNIVKFGNNARIGDGDISINNIGWRRKLSDWNSGKRKAIILPNLHPHKEYLIYITFVKDNVKSEKFLMACFTVDDRSTYYMQLFLILFTIFMTGIFSMVLKGCGVG